MGGWTIKGKPHRYAGGSDPSSMVDYGFKFRLVRAGLAHSVNVEVASGPREVELTEALARTAVAEHLEDDEPPTRIVMARDGTFYLGA
jgi:hypothetical protein